MTAPTTRRETMMTSRYCRDCDTLTNRADVTDGVDGRMGTATHRCDACAAPACTADDLFGPAAIAAAGCRAGR